MVPQNWSVAQLVLFKKPNKTGTEAGHHRPIGLQDQLGKLTFRSLLLPCQDYIYGFTKQFPQYGSTPQRSHKDALRRVFEHCRLVRSECLLQKCTLHDRFAGVQPTSLAGVSRSRWILQARSMPCPETSWSKAC